MDKQHADSMRIWFGGSDSDYKGLSEIAFRNLQRAYAYEHDQNKKNDYLALIVREIAYRHNSENFKEVTE
jgi:hypothetical protein